jgi:hypothetical protein
MLGDNVRLRLLESSCLVCGGVRQGTPRASSTCPSGDLLQDHGLPRTTRSAYEYEPVVKTSRLFELSYGLVIQRLSHHAPLSVSELGSPDASSQRSIAAFRNHQCRPIFWQGTLPSRNTL